MLEESGGDLLFEDFPDGFLVFDGFADWFHFSYQLSVISDPIMIFLWNGSSGRLRDLGGIVWGIWGVGNSLRGA